MNTQPAPQPTFAPLVQACRAFGIGKTKAYELASRGQLRTFRLGTRRFVYIDSLRSLPSREGFAERGHA